MTILSEFTRKFRVINKQNENFFCNKQRTLLKQAQISLYQNIQTVESPTVAARFYITLGFTEKLLKSNSFKWRLLL